MNNVFVKDKARLCSPAVVRKLSNLHQPSRWNSNKNVPSTTRTKMHFYDFTDILQRLGVGFSSLTGKSVSDVTAHFMSSLFLIKPNASGVLLNHAIRWYPWSGPTQRLTKWKLMCPTGVHLSASSYCHGDRYFEACHLHMAAFCFCSW